EPARIAVLLEAIHDADIVSGSRYLRDFRQDSTAPEDRRHINQEITAELNARFGLPLTDAFCGFKAYRREALGTLHITEPGWGVPVGGHVVPRAPAEDGAVVCEPPLSEVGRLLAENRRRLDFADRAWADLRRDARRAAFEAARDYLRRGGEPLPEWNGERLILAGHQPELFHPGVWVKSFALHGLAR